MTPVLFLTHLHFQKARDDLKGLLENEDYLDRISHPSGSSRLGWPAVYESVFRHLQKEAIKLEKDTQRLGVNNGNS